MADDQVPGAGPDRPDASSADPGPDPRAGSAASSTPPRVDPADPPVHIPTRPRDEIDLMEVLDRLLASGELEVDPRKGSIASRSSAPFIGELPSLTSRSSLHFACPRPEEVSPKDAPPTPARDRHVVVTPDAISPEEARTLAPPPGTDYVLQRKIGEGGMGMVFEAEQLCLDRKVAIKTLKFEVADDPKHGRCFMQEALVTGQLDHPNVIPLYELGVDASGITFMVMKRVHGRTWHDLLNPDANDTDLLQLATWMDLVDHIEVLNNVCHAVAFSHSRDILHRDIKPSNVMVGKFGEVFLMDWGLATSSLPDPGADLSLDQGGPQIVGSPSYMAPEMARGDQDSVDKHSDIYLLGATLFEILYGRPPHMGGSTIDVLLAAHRNQVDALEKRPSGEPVPPDLRQACLRAMSTDPRDRHGSVLAFQQDLKTFLLST